MEEELKPQETEDYNVNHKQCPSEASTVIAIASESSSSSPPDSPSWYSPKRLLVIFCVINLLNYLDRGAIASNGVNGSRKICKKDGTCTAGTGIQGDFNLTNFKDGALSSAFMVGLLVASPIFAFLAKRINPFRLVGVGLSVWAIAALGCGLSQNFLTIAICRMLVGVGEASFISLAAPFIDDNAPPSQKNAWLAMFYMCIPSGVALGYVYGGLVASHLNWRAAFYGEAILMTPFAVLGFFVKPLQMKGFVHASSKEASKATETTGAEDEVVSNSKDDVSCIIWSSLTIFGRDMKELLKEKVYVVNVLGYIAYNFVIGAYSYWGPKAGYSIYHMTDADMKFGGITILCGVLGTLGGGFILDYITSTLTNAFKLLSVTTFFGAACCFGAFCFKNVWGFYILFAIGELLVFATQGPVNFVCLHSVKPSMRPLAMAMSTVCIHIFGDVPSSPLVGRMQDHFHNWRTSALILTSVLFLASAIWFIGIFLHSVDRFNEESEEQPTPVVDKRTPLMGEKIEEPAASVAAP